MNPIRNILVRRRLAKLMKPDPAYRARRLAQFSPERRERYMLEILLKAHRPEKYVERVWSELTGKGGGPVVTVLPSDHKPGHRDKAIVRLPRHGEQE